MKRYKIMQIAALLVLSVTILVGCGKIRVTGMYDFFWEYRFEIPFEAEGHFAGKVFFSTNYTLDEQRQLIEAAGYRANIYDFEGARRIFIVATTENHKHFFTIWDREDDLFILDNHNTFIESNIIHEKISEAFYFQSI